MKIKYTVLIFFCFAMVFAHPNINYSYGLLRTVTAENGSAGHFHVGIYTRFFTQTRDVTTLGEQTGEATHMGYDNFFGLGYAFTDYLAFDVSMANHGDALNYSATSTVTRASSGIGDTKIGMKLSLGKGKVKFGLNPFVSLNTGSERDATLSNGTHLIFGDVRGNTGGIFRYHSSGAVDMGVIGIITFQKKAFRLDLNGGYVDRNKNDDALGWKNNYTIYRAALSYDLGTVVPFLELGGIDYVGKDRLITWVDDDSVFGPNEVYITPGIGFRFGGLNIDLALDIRGWEGENTRAFPTVLTDSFNINTGWGVTPPWAANLGISYCADFIGEPPTTGKIAGTVYDRESKEPILANIALYNEEGGMTESAVADENGGYSFTDVKPGHYQINAQAPEYVATKFEVKVMAGEKVPADIPLIRNEGTLIVILEEMEGTLAPSVELTIGTMEPMTVTDRIEEILKAGTYTVTATATVPGYLPFEKEVKIQAGETKELFVTLVREEFKIVLPEVYFETAKSEIKPESYEKLDTAAETIMKIFSGNPTTRIEIQGHTDNRGDDEYNMQLSNDRAGAVKEYLVDEHGIDAERLVAKGYGESKPTASNATSDGMAKNRRVEFVILK